MDTSRARSFVRVALAVLLGMVTGATCGYASCDPTIDPDKTDIANARAAVGANCNCVGAASHGAYVSCAAQQANLTLVNKSCAGAVKRCASRSTCGKPAGAVTCCVTKPTGTKCKIKRDAAHCQAPSGATACVGGFTSCCDACGVSGCATTTTTTTTTLPGVCGDGIVNQPSEQCDGTAGGPDCPLPPAYITNFGCFPPGTPRQCTCCTNYDLCEAYNTTLECCHPDALCLFHGPTYGGVCWHPNCGPGDDCGWGTCVDGKCCVGAENLCFPEGFGPGCCPPAVCVPTSSPVLTLVCCLPGGQACSGNAECCSGSCDPQTSTCS